MKTVLISPSRRRLLPLIAAVLGLLMFSGARAQTDLNKKFYLPNGTLVSSSSPANPGQTVKLRFSVFNQNTTPITNVSFTDYFTSNGLAASNPTLTGIQLTQAPPVFSVVPGTACVGVSGTGPATPTATALSPGSPASTLTGVKVSNFGVRAPTGAETAAECQIEVDVLAISSGNKSNVVPLNSMSVNGSTTNTNSPISETFIVTTISNPIVTKGFGGTAGSTNNQTLSIGTATDLRIRINNTDGAQPITNVKIIDRLPTSPAGLQYDTAFTPVFSTDCAGTPAPSVAYSNGSSGSSNVATLSVSSIPKSGNCDVLLRVSGNAGGTFNNKIQTADITTREAVTDGDGSNTATLTYQALNIAKNFNPNVVDRKSTSDPSTNISKLTITLSNPGTSPVTNAEFSDFMTNGGASTNADLNLRIANPTNLTFNPASCGTNATSTGLTLGATPTNTALADAAAYKVSGISIPGATGAGVGTCQITVDVFGNASITSGQKTNTLLQTNVRVNGNQAAFSDATANLEITPTGVTGRNILSEKDTTNTEIVNLANQSSQSWNDSTVILNSGSNVPPSQSTAWFRLRLWINPASQTTPLTDVSFNDDLPDQLDYTGLLFSPNCGTNSGAGLTSAGGDDRLQVAGLTLSPTNPNATIAGQECVILIRATSTQVGGAYVNTINRFGISSAQGVSNDYGIDARVTVTDAIAVTKTFTPGTIGAGGRSRATITFFNNDTTRTMPQISFSDSLPSGMTIAAFPETSSTCKNSSNVAVLPTLGASSASFSATDNVVLGAASRTATSITPATCSVSFYVKTDNLTTTLTNSIPVGNVVARPSGGNVSNAAAANADLSRVGTTLNISKAFNPQQIDPNQPTTITITITNPSGAPELTNLSFTDDFTRVSGQNNFQVTAPVTASTTCNGTSSAQNPPAGTVFTGAIKNAAGNALAVGDTSVRLENGFLAPNASCTISVVVTGQVRGNQINRIPAVTVATAIGTAGEINSDQGRQNNNLFDSTLSVFTTLAVSKSFSPTTILPGSGTSDMTIQVFSSFTTTVNNLAVTDFFTSDGTSSGTATGIVIAPTPAVVANTCGGTITQTAGDNKVSLSGGTLPSGTACSFTIRVAANKIPTATANNSFVNTIPAGAVTGNDGSGTGSASNRRPVTATLTTPPPPTVTKAFAPVGIVPGQTSQLTITLTNPTTTAATLTSDFVDTLPTGFVIAGAFSSSCGSPAINVTSATTTPGVITATALTIPAGTATIPATCTITVPVTSDTTNNFGTRNNVIPKDALKTNIGNNPAAAIASIALEKPLQGVKSVRLTTDADNSQTITTGDTVTWSVFYKNISTVTIDGVQISDALPAGVTRTGAAAMTATLLSPSGASVSSITVNGAYTGTGNVLAAGQDLTAGQIIRVDIPVIVTVSAGNQDNRAEATYPVQPSSFPNPQTDTADSTTPTVNLPAGVTIPTGAGIFAAVSQTPTQTGATNDFTRVTPVATPAAQGLKFVARTTDPDGNGQNTIGDTLTWSVFYKNTGTVTINNVQIADVLPTGLTFNGITVGPTVLTINGTSNSANRNTAYDGSSANQNLLTGTLNLAPGDVIRVDIPAKINSSVPTNGQLDNQAKLTATNLPTAGILTDAADLTTSVTGITPPANSQPQVVGGSSDATRALVVPVVSGKVYVDVNNNGSFDIGEPAIAGVTVTVTPSSGPPFTLTTDASGNYSTPVPVGSTVSILETQPLGYGNGTPNTLSGIAVPITGSANNNFGELTGGVSGKVFLDALNNGTFEGTDSGITNQCITLTGTDYGLDGAPLGTGVNADTAVTLSTRTNASGDYSFARGVANTVFTSADCSGTAITTFPGLRRGDYTITQTNQPANTLNGITTAGAATTGGTAGTATVVTTVPSTVGSITLGAGQTSAANNFAEIAPSSLSGRVFETFNNDAIQQAAETNNLGGTTVTLSYTDDLGRTVVQTATTASGNVAAGTYTNTISVNGGAAQTVTLAGAPALSAGQYYFGNIRPTQTGTTYTVTETQPAGFSSNPLNTASGSAGGTTTANNVVSAIPSLAPGTNATGYDFAEYKPVTISGVVFAERNGTPNYQSGVDNPIAGATVQLTDASGNPVPGVADQTTPASGAYSFTNLPPGTYGVVEPTQPSGTINDETFAGTVAGGQTAGSSGGTPTAIATVPSKVTTITAQSGNTIGNVNFGEIFSGRISGIVYQDPNNNGAKDSGEAAISGVRVELSGTDSSGNAVTRAPVATLPDGSYEFTQLPPGTYTITEKGRNSVPAENQLPDFFDGKATPGTTGATTNGTTGTQGTVPSTISGIVLGGTPATNNSLLNNFGELPKSTLSGKVFETFDNNATQEGVNISGTKITLTYKDEQGRDIEQTTLTAPTAGTLAGETTNTFKINGIAQPDITCPAAPALTAGQYYFCEIRPTQTGTTYTVTETQPATFSSNPLNTAAGSAGGVTTTNDVVSAIGFAPGTNATGYNFAEYKPVTIQGVVFAERNGTANYQSGADDPIQGATVSLRDSSGNPISGVPDQTTPVSGAYSFTNLPPGNYQVVEPTQPAGTVNQATFAGTVAGGQTLGSSVGAPSETPSRVTGIVAQSGNSFSNLNFGETFVAGISGVVYRDLNDDGQIGGAGETGIAGIRVELRDSSNNIVVLGGVPQIATTDSSGAYSFPSLPAGTYNLVELGRTSVSGETQIPDFFDGKATPGTNLATGNGTAPAGQQGAPPTRINSITLGTTPTTNTSLNNNFGEIPKSTLRGKVFETFNNDAIQQATETNNLGATAVALSYTDVNNRTIVQTTTTASGGVAAGATTNTISVNGAPATTTTCSSAPALTAGQYYFCDILPLQAGTTYTVTETQPAGFSSNPLNTAPGSAGGTPANNSVTAISFVPGTNATGYDFAEYKPVTISGVVFAERNNIPNYQSGIDDPIQGVSVSLRDGFGNPIPAVSDQTTPASGAYSFTNLPPGNYQIIEPTQPAGTVNQATFAGTVAGGQTLGSSVGVPSETPSRVTGIVAQSGNSFSNVNFGEKFNGQISGIVYQDSDNNGVQDAGEAAIPGIRVELRDASDAVIVLGGVAQVTTTDATGAYSFPTLPPGVYNVVELGRTSVPGETQIPDFFDGKATPGTNLATGNGTAPAGQQGTPPTRINSITLGTTATTNNSVLNNFSEIPKSTLRGKVFETFNNDNLQTGAEPPLAGVTVTLSFTDITGRQIVQTTTTAPAAGIGAGLTKNTLSVNGVVQPDILCAAAPVLAAGQYYFCDILPLQAGTTYTVTETQPAGFSSNPLNTAPGSAGGTPANNSVTAISFVPGTNATGYDFAEYKPVTISGVVFAERNNIPNYQSGIDDPIQGATVSLRDATGNPIPGVADQTTPVDGTYSFTNLPPGTYGVLEPIQPVGTINDATFGGTVSGGQTAGSSGGTPTPIATVPSNVSGIVAQSGNTIGNVNFGEKYNGQISGIVYEDRNDNGVQDAGEPVIPGVRVELTGTDSNGNAVTRAPVATLADGSYLFDQLPPGTYTITEKGRNANPTENQLPNFGDGKATPGTTGAVTNGTPGTQGTSPSTITGIVLGSTPATNNSTLNNFGELTADLELVKTVNNAAPSTGGTVKFTLTVTNKGPAAATGVTVQDVLPAGFTYLSSNPSAGVSVTGQTVDWNAGTIPSGGTSSLEISATVNANQPAAAYVNAAQISGSDIKDPDSTPGNGTGNTEDDRAQVSVTPRGNINGTVFKDENGNGIQDPGEAPIPNVLVTITPAGGGSAFIVKTDANGIFDTATLPTPGVPSGTYTVDIDDTTLPADYRNQSAGTDPTQVTVAAGENKKEEDNGYRPTGNLNGSVFNDLNGNGVRDPGEPGIPNVPVVVSRPTAPGVPFTPVTVLTDADGNYSAPGIPTGPAIVTVTDAVPVGNGFTRVPANTATNPGGNNPTPITVISGSNPAGDDPFRKEGSVKEHVFEDSNGNGRQDPGEPNLPGVKVTVTDAGGKVSTGITNANGDAIIPGILEGTATVDVDDTTLPPGITAQTAGTDPSTVTVVPNVVNDAGFDGYQPRGTIGGLVWRDDNGDGIRDGNEPLFPGVTVTITDQFGKVTVVTTGPDGRYSAVVASGPVTVVYTDPVNHRLTTNNRKQTVTVPTAGNANAGDVGYQPLTGGLAGRVFYDTNANGVQDPGEPGIAGVTVKITDAKNNVVTLTTDKNGDYSTAPNELAFGPARVVVIPPADHVVTTNNLDQTVNVPAGAIGRVPDVGLVKPGISLEKNVVQNGVIVPRTETPRVSLGGNLEYQITVSNSGPVPLRELTVTDSLPLGLVYLKGTSKLEGAALADPTVTNNAQTGKQTLVWRLPAAQVLAPGAKLRIRFLTNVTPETRGDQLINAATASAKAGPTGSTITISSNTSTAAVKVDLGVFTNKSVILGRVYFDVNNNDSFEQGTDKPLPGARVYLSDGRSSITDTLGRYSFPDVAPGVYTARLDPVTAPYSVKRVADDQGSPGSRYVRAPDGGGILHEDFLLIEPKGAVVKSRDTLVQRGPVTLTKTITQGGAGYAVTFKITVTTAVRDLSITDPLPQGAERGPLTGAGATLEGNILRFSGVTQPGTYTVTYALFTALPPDLALTDPDINYTQIFTLIPVGPGDAPNSSGTALTTPSSNETAPSNNSGGDTEFSTEVIR